jgi:hypothetical protein
VLLLGDKAKNPTRLVGSWKELTSQSMADLEALIQQAGASEVEAWNFDPRTGFGGLACLDWDWEFLACEFDGEHRFFLPQLYGKLVNVSIEPSTLSVLQTLVLKKITGEDKLGAPDQKGLIESHSATVATAATGKSNWEKPRALTDLLVWDLKLCVASAAAAPSDPNSPAKKVLQVLHSQGEPCEGSTVGGGGCRFASEFYLVNPEGQRSVWCKAHLDGVLSAVWSRLRLQVWQRRAKVFWRMFRFGGW